MTPEQLKESVRAFDPLSYRKKSSGPSQARSSLTNFSVFVGSTALPFSHLRDSIENLRLQRSDFTRELLAWAKGKNDYLLRGMWGLFTMAGGHPE